MRGSLVPLGPLALGLHERTHPNRGQGQRTVSTMHRLRLFDEEMRELAVNLHNLQAKCSLAGLRRLFL